MTYPVITNEEADVKRLEKNLILLNDMLRKHHDYIQKKYKVSALEMEIMQFVMTEGPQKMKDVAHHFHIKLSTLTSVIDKAEKARIVKRVNSKEDRRVVFLDITKRGKNIFQEYQKYLKSMVAQMQHSLEPDAFDLFVEGMETFTRISLR